ncbi:MAG: threonine/serine exporter family protein [Muribaculaceae bacterium]|nr:threonine/serine exporter family protein [Muribaculaceae bacterium]
MTTSMTSEARPDPAALCRFLSRYCSLLLGCGATCIRLEKNAARIAHAYGMELAITIMPRHIHLSVWRSDAENACTEIASAAHVPVSFALNTGLSELSWAVADGRIDFSEATRLLQDADSAKAAPRPWVPVAVAAANASFCRLFGGDVAAMAVVAAATLAGFITRQHMLRRGIDLRITVAVCALVSGILGATCLLFGLGDTPDVAMATCALYLVPGIPFLNSFTDLLYRHYICALSRFIDAMVLTACLSAGLCTAMLLMQAGMF